MQIFERDGKINFVDEKNVYLGYDMSQDCCEHAEWFIADRQMDEIIDRDPKAPLPDLSAWEFDTGYFCSIDKPHFLDDGGMVVFRLFKHDRSYTKDDENKFLHIFNSHNGYYGHGFSFEINGKVKHEGIL